MKLIPSLINKVGLFLYYIEGERFYILGVGFLSLESLGEDIAPLYLEM